MNKKQRKILYPIIFFIGLTLMAWQISIFRNTIIDSKILVSVVLITGIVTYLLDFSNYKKTYKYTGFYLHTYALMHYILGYGFIVCSTFMLTNYYFADNKTITKEFKIIERYSLSGRKRHRSERKPTFIINYEGENKELVFPHEFYKNMETYTSVEFEVRKGYFGFEILENKKLK